MSDKVDGAELSVGFLSTLPAEARATLAEKAQIRNYKAGEQIFAAGDPGTSLHIVRSGRAKVLKFSISGAEQVLEEYERGGVCGELSVFAQDDARRTATFVATEDCSTIEVSKKDFDLCLANGDVARTMLGAMAVQLTQKKEARTLELYEARFETILLLARAAETFDEATGRHILRMASYSARLGQGVGLSQADTELLLSASMLHDVGKFSIPESILKKPGKFEPHEYEEMKKHTTLGYDMLDGAQSREIRVGREIALQHHEKWDGSGYPRGLRAEDIMLEARLCAVADVFDALTSKRPYKDPMPLQRALDILRTDAGTHFDPDVVGVLLDSVEDLVKLQFIIDLAPTIFLLAVVATARAHY